MSNTPPEMSPPNLRPKVAPRPKMFPPPEFPPRKIKTFAKTPPAVFASLLGLLGLGLAMRRGAVVLGLSDSALAGVIEAILGASLAVFGFGIMALAVKFWRRPAVILEDMRVLPGRAGLAAASMGVMASASVIAPYSSSLAVAVLWGGLALHVVLALLWIKVWLGLPAEGRVVTPAWHLSFVGFIVGAASAVNLGMLGLAQGIFWATLPIAAAIWGISLAQLIARIPPAPLRPMLAMHLAPAALFTTVAQGLGEPLLALSFASFGAVILAALVVSGRWVAAAGFSPLWGSFTFPISAYALALMAVGGVWADAGIFVLIAALGLVPMVVYRVLRLWANGKLAAKTNAAEA
jgi:tellurite resistance protein